MKSSVHCGLLDGGALTVPDLTVLHIDELLRLRQQKMQPMRKPGEGNTAEIKKPSSLHLRCIEPVADEGSSSLL